MKKVMKTVVRDSQQYIEELLMRGVQHHGYDSESIISSVPSLSLYAARAKQREAKRLKMAKENPNGAANSNDLSSSRAVRHFVKQLMEKQQEQAKLRYDAKLMKRKRPPKPHPSSQSEPNRDETLTIYQRDLLTRNQSRTSWTWILYCFLMFAGVLFLLGLFYLVAQKAYRVLFPNWHKNEKNSRVFFSDYVIQ
ncbi:unnamed protein product [Orchesella dallaii]|uniref:Uncharacterized protein n=1 Tax=Orchesella dallaii TaxID=48710 RepID=A0ABP1R565_9HEXA